MQSVNDDRPGCDEGLEIYAYIFDYFYNSKQHTGKLKNYDGRSQLDTFVGAVLHGHLRTDWIRHKRKMRVDQITYPEEIQRLPRLEHKVFEQMLMQRSTETIARNVGANVQDVELAQRRVTHALLSNGNLHLILRHPEEGIDDSLQQRKEASSPRVLNMEWAINVLWEKICAVIQGLPEEHKILLDMAFDQELGAKEMLDRTVQLRLKLPVSPRSGKLTIHTIYQSIDAILKTVGSLLMAQYPAEVDQARQWLGQADEERAGISSKGLKALLKEMGLGTIAMAAMKSATKEQHNDK
ncbi:MAG: hypothetical protein RhofKO_35790 [Rhodothermales bacterium]